MRYQPVFRNIINCLQLSDTFWIILTVNIFLFGNKIIIPASATPAADNSVKKHDCPNSIEHCSKDMKTILNDTRFTFAQNDNQLDILCSHLNRSITCINKFIECDSMSTLKKDSINGMLQLMDKLCSKSSKFRIDYLKHAECYHRLAPVYSQCYQLYYISEKKRIELHRNITDTQHLILWCCNYKNHRKCTSDPVHRACGPRAVNLAEQIVIISHGQDVLDNCPKDILKSSDCLKHWDNLGLLVNTTYRKDGNMDFLTSDGKILFPDRISTSGSLSSMIIRRNDQSKKTLLCKLFSSSTSLIQLMAFTIIIIIYSDLNVFNSLTIQLSPSTPPSSSRRLTSTSPISTTPAWLPKRLSYFESLLSSLVPKGKESQSKT